VRLREAVAKEELKETLEVIHPVVAVELGPPFIRFWRIVEWVRGAFWMRWCNR
jgi:hypothetical protein